MLRLQGAGRNEGKATARLTAISHQIEQAGADGRFAPSPTGPLHLGSLYIALASFLDARSLGGRWQLRIDDLDAPRNDPKAEAQILRALEAHGLHWDGPLVRQSQRIARYEAALASLAEQGRIFHCTCSRRELRGQTRYPGTCRQRIQPVADAALRLRVNGAAIAFDDLVQGRLRVCLGQALGDFTVQRRDGIIAYHLATALDDGADEIGRVVRGRDLLDCTAPQLHLMRLLGLAAPRYAHLPLLLNPSGQKLSKQTLAPPVDARKREANLRLCLKLLGLRPAPDLQRDALLPWAIERWRLAEVPRHDRIAEAEFPASPQAGRAPVP